MLLVTDSAPAVTRCQNCGAALSPDAGRCLVCGVAPSTRPKIVLAITLLFIIAGFTLTHYFVNLHRATESSLAIRWFKRGDEAMQANLPAVAADDYRTALSYDRTNQQYRLRLAQALLADNRLVEARSHLSSLWEEEPADGEVNLTLARLEARRGHYSAAVRYYRNAINGVWNEDPRQRRIAARFELSHYLMNLNQLAEAQAELMALEADGPANPADQLLLGNMLLQVSEPPRAVDAFDAVLARDPNSAQAWMGKGEALLLVTNYRDAESALANAVDRDPNLADARQQLELVREILRLDPALRGLSVAERARRTAEAFQIAFKRLNTCSLQQGYTLAAAPANRPAGAAGAKPVSPPSTNTTAAPQAGPTVTPTENELQRLYATGAQKQATATEYALQKDPDALEPTMQYVFDVERATAPICTQMDVADHALLTLAQHESETVK